MEFSYIGSASDETIAYDEGNRSLDTWLPKIVQPFTLAEQTCSSGDVQSKRARSQVRWERRMLNSEILTDHELLQIVLLPVVKRRDLGQLAQALLTEYRTFGAVVHASMDSLMATHGLGKAGATALRAVGLATVHVLRQKLRSGQMFHTDRAIKDYVIAKIQHERIEVFMVMYLDSHSRLIGDEILWRGSIDHCPAYPREIMKRCLALDVSALIIAHNHPGGHTHPSLEDLALTRYIVKAAAVFEIEVRDHIIACNGEAISLRTRRLM